MRQIHPILPIYSILEIIENKNINRKILIPLFIFLQQKVWSGEYDREDEK